MAKLDLRRPADSTVEAIFRARAGAEAAEPRRQHLGPSVLGHECERAIWYGFRWAFPPAGAGTREAIELGAAERGRVLRLFDHGKLIEGHLIAGLRAAGYVVEEQVPVDLGDGIVGTADGVITGLPEAPAQPHLLELKSANKRSFEAIEAKGLVEAKPAYHVQVQLYMKGLCLERALFLAACKDDDRIYGERVAFDLDLATPALARAKRIRAAAEPPPRIGDADSFACKFCDWRAGCHGQVAPLRNCRTCVSWELGTCDHTGHALTPEVEARGCRQHRFIPSLLHWLEVGDAREQRFVAYTSGWTDEGSGTP